MTSSSPAPSAAHAKRAARSAPSSKTVYAACLEPSPLRPRYTLPDLRAGDPEAADPLERYTWPELRELIYGDPGTR